MQGGRGQAGGSSRQLNLLADVGLLLDNARNKYWRMSNGYALPDREGGIGEVSARVVEDAALRDAVVQALRVAVHWNTQVPARLCV